MSAIERLYGLKLYQGIITENKIPAKYRENAIAYAKELSNK